MKILAGAEANSLHVFKYHLSCCDCAEYFWQSSQHMLFASLLSSH